MKFIFVTDASTDVPEELQEKYNIHTIPIEVRFGEETYPEGLSKREFYSKMASTGLVPKTSMPNAYKFENFYRPYVNKEDTFVITIVISMELSQTKIQAQMAADELGMKNVFIEESCGATIFTGAIMVELAKYVEKVQDIEKIKAKFYELRSKVKLFAIINDLKYLRASGRLSGAGATIGGMLNIKPIVSIIDGKVVNIAKCIGTGKAEAYLFDAMKNIDPDMPLYILHSDAMEKCKALYDKTKPKVKNKEIVFGEIGCIVGSHVGAGCYGYCFFEK